MAEPFNICADACSCPPEWCAHFVEPPTDCIMRLPGDVRVLTCGPCKSGTWHQNGKCLKCGSLYVTPEE